MERILIVDDEPSVRLFYTDVLTDNGYEVVEADSGEAAMGHIQNGTFDLVALDIRLRSQSGLDVLQEIVSKNPGLPVILLTGYLSFQDDYTTWLADSYVLKSNDPTEFVQEVRRILNVPGKPVPSQEPRSPVAQTASLGGDY